MNVDFTGKVVLVTGASAGIGEATALLFARLGAKLALVGRNAETLAAVAEQCAAPQGLVPLAIVADLARKLPVTPSRILADVLVNNAGVGARATLETTDMEAFDRVFNTNVRGVYNLTRLLAPELVKTKGNIVNVSSISGTTVQVSSLPYSMSKAALDHFTRLISLELAPKGVRVNTVSPGITVSKFVQRLTNYSDEQYQAWLHEAAGSIPLGKVCSGEDVAKMIAYLASEHSALVTGTVVQVDGGLQFGTVGNLLKRQVKEN